MTQLRDQNRTRNGRAAVPATASFDGDEPILALMDHGEANRRILARTEFIADFRRVEAASLKFRVRLCSAEGKRALHRYFYSFQANLYVVSSIGRLKLAPAAVEKVESEMRAHLDKANERLNRAIDEAEKLFKNHAIETPATFDSQPLEVAVGVIDSLGRRYLEIIQKMDQLMPLLQTLEIWEVVRKREVGFQCSAIKRMVRNLASTARVFAIGIRKRSSAIDALRVAHGAMKPATVPASAGVSEQAREDTTISAIAAVELSAEEVAESVEQAQAPVEAGTASDEPAVERIEADASGMDETRSVSEPQPAL